MSAYRLFGAETSPYSLKVRSFLRYKGIEFEWITRSRETETDFRALARHATVPLLVSPDRPVSQESTRMLFALENASPEPSAIPDDPALTALSLILEDYGDEWLNKCMFQQRWSGKPDRDQAGPACPGAIVWRQAPARLEEAVHPDRRAHGRPPAAGRRFG